MKIALLGYGRMGQTIEKIAIERGHEIVLKVDENTKSYDVAIADVAIEFSIPSAAVSNLKQCFEAQVPVVSGTTGWLDSYEEMVQLCKSKNAAFIYASNFSLGVNIFFELNKKLAAMMNPQKHYSIATEEIHHTKKLDAPSGTAITLAEGIIQNSDHQSWTLGPDADRTTIPIVAKREGDVPGTHTITYNSEIDQIEIKHTAHNRQGFALGAVVAAEWLQHKKGIYKMNDVLGL